MERGEQMNPTGISWCGKDWKGPDPIQPYEVEHKESEERFAVIDECCCGEMIQTKSETGTKWVYANRYRRIDAHQETPWRAK